jgi:hypothetical protein
MRRRPETSQVRPFGADLWKSAPGNCFDVRPLFAPCCYFGSWRFPMASVEMAPFFVLRSLGLGGLGKRIPEIDIPLHGVLGEGRRGIRQAHRNNDRRNSKRQATADRH